MSTTRRYSDSIDLSNDGASLWIEKRHTGYFIWGVQTKAHLTNKGYATKLLNRLCRFADKRGHTLSLGAAPFGHRTLNFDQLIAFYGKFGFKPLDEYGYMKRCPQSLTVDPQ